VAVISTVICANGVVNAICKAAPAAKAITHTEGCGRGLTDIAIASRTLIGLGRNPNVGAVLVVGLGCEFIKAQQVAEGIKSAGKPVAFLVIQEEGGTRKTTDKGLEIARQFLADLQKQKREERDWNQLTVGLECGGSDALSGVTANPLTGMVSDWLVSQGATVILAETTEMIGAENVLARRAATPQIASKIVKLIQDQKQLTQDLLGPLAGLVISPGNIEGGLSSIAEKSLGCVIKAGSSPVNELVAYANPPSQRGLVIMDTPGSDIFQLTGMAAGGAQLIIFTTGRGTPAGCPLAPVIKVASNTETFNKMRDDMDVNAGRLLEGASMEEASQDLIQLAKRVAEGEPTKAEINEQDLLAIHTTGPAF
jgi:altronate dehydratase large subunit